MQAGVFLLPVAQALRDRLGLALQLGEIPGRGSLVEPVPGELLDDEKRRKLCDLVHGELEVGNMVERAAGDDHVERRGGSELFECHALEDRPFRRDRIDRSDVVAARGKRECDLPLAAPDVEHARRGPGELREHEITESHGPAGSQTAELSKPRQASARPLAANDALRPATDPSAWSGDFRTCSSKRCAPRLMLCLAVAATIAPASLRHGRIRRCRPDGRSRAPLPVSRAMDARFSRP